MAYYSNHRNDISTGLAYDHNPYGSNQSYYYDTAHQNPSYHEPNMYRSRSRSRSSSTSTSPVSYTRRPNKHKTSNTQTRSRQNEPQHDTLAKVGIIVGAVALIAGTVHLLANRRREQERVGGRGRDRDWHNVGADERRRRRRKKDEEEEMEERRREEEDLRGEEWEEMRERDRRGRFIEDGRAVPRDEMEGSTISKGERRRRR